jgi:hypothetical protein
MTLWQLAHLDENIELETDAAAVDGGRRVTLRRTPCVVPASLPFTDDAGNESSVVPFLAGKTLSFSLDL